MKYLKIKNKGLVEPEALYLLGASTKRDDETKIGQFGSGNKYALAYLLRNNYDLRIYSGMNKIDISTEPKVFRGRDFEVIHINGKDTSITTEMGKDWKLWQAIREIYCNAMDEEMATMEFVQDVSPSEDETHFYIDVKNDVMEFMKQFDAYFAVNKEVLFECPEGRILKKTGNKTNIYRKGVRCFETDKKSIYDYDLHSIDIDENRLVKYFWTVEEKVWSLIYQCNNEEVIMNVLHNCSNDDFTEGCLSDISAINSSNASDTFKNCIKKLRTAPKGYAGLLKPDEVNNHVILPTKIFKSIRGYMEDDNVGKAFKVTNSGAMFREFDKDKLQEKVIKDSFYFLNECGLQINYPVKTVVFDEKNVLAAAYNGEILLSDIVLSKGVNATVIALIEEYIHIKHEVSDETRAFQIAIITEFVDYMKKQNAFSL